MMRFIIAAPDEATLSRRNPQFRISISGSAFDLRYQRISGAGCDIRHLSFLRFLRTEEIHSGESDPQIASRINSTRGCSRRLAPSKAALVLLGEYRWAEGQLASACDCDV